VIGGPTNASGYTWWQLRTSGGTTGWAVQDWLANTGTPTQPTPTPTPPPTTPPPPTSGKFAINSTVRVTETLNMRSGAGTGNGIVATLPAGTTATVLEGPTSASGYTWWRVRTSGGTTGWVAENWLAAVTPSTPAFKAGDSFTVTEALNMRTGAGTGNGIVATLPAGTTGTITGGPQSASGYTWWSVNTSRGSGWVVQNWIRKS
jgi:D-alanyl-D-alanine carboxypeptidase